MFVAVDRLIQEVESSIVKPRDFSKELYAGIDLGTAYMVIIVVDGEGKPITGAYRFAQVVRDGVVVDFSGATRIVRELKEEIELKLGTELVKGAVAFPPGTGNSTIKAHSYIAEGAGFEIVNIIDEPTAANKVLNIKNGAVVDIGGGTTGIAVIKNGRVVYTADEPTGGIHFSLVIAGALKKSVEEAEKYKKTPQNHEHVIVMVKPVIQKIANIIGKHIREFNVDSISLVGGTSCLKGIECIIRSELAKNVYKPENPFFVTPLGIALSCLEVRTNA
jgi:ethanolamine utilization protein EutJ